MEFRRNQPSDSEALAALFADVFSKSEGEAEGALVSQLVEELLEKTDQRDLYGFVAADEGWILGSIFFSRLTFEHSVDAFILAPVAVHSDHQGKGIGQALIRYGLSQLKDEGVSVVLTYGDPRFYQRVGFRHVSHDVIRAPFQLSQPEGWLGQSLGRDPIENLSGGCTCVEAFNDPVYW